MRSWCSRNMLPREVLIFLNAYCLMKLRQGVSIQSWDRHFVEIWAIPMLTGWWDAVTPSGLSSRTDGPITSVGQDRFCCHYCSRWADFVIVFARLQRTWRSSAYTVYIFLPVASSCSIIWIHVLTYTIVQTMRSKMRALFQTIYSNGLKSAKKQCLINAGVVVPCCHPFGMIWRILMFTQMEILCNYCDHLLGAHNIHNPASTFMYHCFKILLCCVCWNVTAIYLEYNKLEYKKRFSECFHESASSNATFFRQQVSWHKMIWSVS